MGSAEILTGPVENKLASVRERLLKTLTAKPKRAEAPPRDVLAALEAACINGKTVQARFKAGWFRILAGASARFDDGQHLEPALLEMTDTAIQGRAWQTKTLDAGDTSRIYPVTCILFAYTGKPWWESFWAAHLEMMRDPLLANRDYMLPKPSPDGTGFLPQPCPRDTALNHYRGSVRTHAGLFELSEEAISKLTLPGLLF